MSIHRRPSRDQVLMENAESWSTRSTCSRAQVGAVISRDGRTLSTGYNGAPASMDHCDHQCTCGVEGDPEDNFHLPDCESIKPCANVIHAEANAIAFAAKHGVALNLAELHCTRVPCTGCAGLIINAGIQRVVWLETHRDMGGWERLAQAGIQVIRWEV